MSIRHSKSEAAAHLKPPRWAFHHGVTRLRRADASDRRRQPPPDDGAAHVVDAGDGGLVAPEPEDAPASEPRRQPPPRDYSRRTRKRDELGPVHGMHGDGVAMRRLALMIGVFAFASAVLIWLMI